MRSMSDSWFLGHSLLMEFWLGQTLELAWSDATQQQRFVDLFTPETNRNGAEQPTKKKIPGCRNLGYTLRHELTLHVASSALQRLIELKF